MISKNKSIEAAALQMYAVEQLGLPKKRTRRSKDFDAISHVEAEMAVSRQTAIRYLSMARRSSTVEAPGTPLILRRRISELENELSRVQSKRITAHVVREQIMELPRYQPAAPVWPKKTSPSDGHPGVPVLMLSDLHWGEVIEPAEIFGLNSYDIATAQSRLQYTVQKGPAILSEHVSPNNFSEMVLILGGDMVSGDIHDELSITNEREIMPVVMDCADNLAQAVRHLCTYYGKVHVKGVPGNHGRTTRKPRKKFYAETNWDWLIYQMLERFCADLVAAGTVEFDCPSTRDMTFTILNHSYRLTHGDQFRGGDSIIGPLGPITRGNMKKRSAAMSMPGRREFYDTLILGHFHRLMMLPNMIMNGSLKGYDEFAASNNYEFEPPQQAMWIVHPRWGQNYYVPLICDPKWSEGNEDAV